MCISEWTSKTWLVESDSDVGLLEGDRLSFSAPGEGIQVQNRSFIWCPEWVYEDDFNARVTYSGDIYLLARSGSTLTCTRNPMSVPDLEEAPPVLGDTPPSSWTAIEGGNGG